MTKSSGVGGSIEETTQFMYIDAMTRGGRDCSRVSKNGDRIFNLLVKAYLERFIFPILINKLVGTVQSCSTKCSGFNDESEEILKMLKNRTRHR